MKNDNAKEENIIDIETDNIVGTANENAADMSDILSDIEIIETENHNIDNNLSSDNEKSESGNGKNRQKEVYSIAKLSLSKTVNSNINVPEFSFFVNQSNEIII